MSCNILSESKINLYPRLNCKHQDDEDLINFVTNKIIIKPPDREVDLDKIKRHKAHSEYQQDEFVDNIIFQGK